MRIGKRILAVAAGLVVATALAGTAVVANATAPRSHQASPASGASHHLKLERFDLNGYVFDTSYTQNGRATFSFSSIDAADATELESADFLLILNRNDNIIPAVAKLNAEQAAAYFMLGETQGTSAGGADEAGVFLRVPGTNPFFPMPHDLQGNRFLELLAQHPLEVYVMNTGRVGGPEDDERSRKVRMASLR